MLRFIRNRRFLSAGADGGGALPEGASLPEVEGAAGQEEKQTEEGAAPADSEEPPDEPDDTQNPTENVDLNKLDEHVKTAVAEELKKASMTDGS